MLIAARHPGITHAPVVNVVPFRKVKLHEILNNRSIFNRSYTAATYAKTSHRRTGIVWAILPVIRATE